MTNSPLNTELTSLEAAIVHRVGNRQAMEGIVISDSLISLRNEVLQSQLSHYFLKAFKQPEFYRFGFSNGDPQLNAVYRFCHAIFAEMKNSDPGGQALQMQSIHMAKHLYELSEHPNIKAGDLFVAYFENVVCEGRSCDAVGIYKAENKHSFLQVQENQDGLHVEASKGISPEKLDKGCLVINTEAEDGYRVLAVDHTNRGQDARYWLDHFLRLEPVEDAYYHTRTLMNETREFIAHSLPESAQLDGADKAELMNKTADYFRQREMYVEDDFAQEVLQRPELVVAYQRFRENKNGEAEGMEAQETKSIALSETAVKKYGKIYKSVLKLDKNFHVYIHGDRSLIERGREPDGRKYYKIYYEEEN